MILRFAVCSALILINVAFDVEFDTKGLDPNIVPIYHALIGKSSYTNVSDVDSMLQSLEELSMLQRKIVNITVEPEKLIKKGPTEIFKRRLFRFIQKKHEPMQMPFLFQGDMVLTQNQMTAVINSVKRQLVEKNGINVTQRSQRSLTSNLAELWDELPIQFTIDENVNREAILGGLKLWSDNTCISFKETENITKGIEFIKGSGCFSNVGMTGQKQSISIGIGCDRSAIVAHEIGHALGAYHEQSRFDRDDYIKVMFDFIIPGMESNFVKVDPSVMNTYNVSYDFASVMHYNSFGFAFNSENKTLETIDPNFVDTIGQREILSFNDIKRINFAYCKNVCNLPLNCLHSSYPDPKNCSRCLCPDGFSGTFCEKIAKSSLECGAQTHIALNSVEQLSISGNQTCYYMFIGRPGQVITLTVDGIQFDDVAPCIHEYLELRYGREIGDTGARLCEKIYQRSVISATNKMFIIFKGLSALSGFNVSFSALDVDAPMTNRILLTAMPSTEMISSTEPTTRMAELLTTVETTTIKSSSTTSRMRRSGSTASIELDNSQWPFTKCIDNITNVTIPYRMTKSKSIEEVLTDLLTVCSKKVMIELGKKQLEALISHQKPPPKKHQLEITIDVDYSDLLDRIDIS